MSELLRAASKSDRPSAGWPTAYFLGIVALVISASAMAYRPFDSTDADVAGEGKTELEIGTFGSLHQVQNKYWTAPTLVANFGFKGERELTVEGQGEHLRNGPSDVTQASLVNTGVFVKQMLRRGILQGETGKQESVWPRSTAYCVLLPELDGQNSAGLSWAAIASQRWAALTMYLMRSWN